MLQVSTLFSLKGSQKWTERRREWIKEGFEEKFFGTESSDHSLISLFHPHLPHVCGLFIVYVGIVSIFLGPKSYISFKNVSYILKLWTELEINKIPRSILETICVESESAEQILEKNTILKE